MKSFTILITPAIIGIIFCSIIGAGFWYYIIAWLAGLGIGTLALFAWFQVKSTKSNTTVRIQQKNYQKKKFHKSKKLKK